MLRLTVFLSLGVLPAVALAAARKPMPPEGSLTAAKRVVVDTFSKELSAADKVPAIQAMLETAAGAKGDDAGQAALYLSAAEVAARAGETKLAFEAIDGLGAAFDCDVLGLKANLLDAAAKYAKTNEVRTSIAHRGLELADSAAAAGQFDVAESALKTAGAASVRLRDAELRKDVAGKRKEIEKAKRQHDQEQAAFDEAQTTLKNKPDDPGANEAVGKHLAFDRNDWAKGLKHLAKAADPDLQKAAIADQSGGGEASHSAALGDAWWNLAEQSDSLRDRAGFKSRSVFWYTRAAAGLTGLAKARVEKRLKEAGDEALAAAAEQTGGENGKFIDVTLAPGVLMRLVKIPASKDGKIKSFYLGQTEVTQKQWAAVMGSNPSSRKGDSMPVTDVSLDDANAFCAKVGASQHRLAVRLPSPSEHEHAQFTAFTGVSVDRLDEFAWQASNSGDTTHPVATKSADSLGLSDLVGNAYEWCSDSGRVYGGSYHDRQVSHPEKSCYFTDVKTGEKGVNIGFRLAATLR